MVVNAEIPTVLRVAAPESYLSGALGNPWKRKQRERRNRQMWGCTDKAEVNLSQASLVYTAVSGPARPHSKAQSQNKITLKLNKTK